MNSNADGYGCGCLFLFMLGLILAMVYPFYDGYFIRDLPEGVQSSIEAESHVILKTAYLDENSCYVSVTLTNNSGWVIEESRVLVTFRSGDESYRCSLKLEKPYQNGKLGLSSSNSPEEYWLTLPKDGVLFLKENNLEESHSSIWMRGRRRPFKLVKAPVDWVMGLFERVEP